MLLVPRPTPKLEDHPSSAVHDCLFNLSAATLHIGGCSCIRKLRTRLAVVTGTHITWEHACCEFESSLTLEALILSKDNLLQLEVEVAILAFHMLHNNLCLVGRHCHLVFISLTTKNVWYIGRVSGVRISYIYTVEIICPKLTSRWQLAILAL